jgi:hypothetical protein
MRCITISCDPSSRLIFFPVLPRPSIRPKHDSRMTSNGLRAGGFSSLSP